jgi:dihydroflavonol-4-reductase
MKKRYIVTGAGGHLGSTILRLLSNTDNIVYALIMPKDSRVVLASNITYIEGDVRNIASLEPLFSNIKDEEVYVIHCAGLISIALHLDSNIYDVNVTGTKNIVSLCQKYRVTKLVYVSSVHAITELPNNKIMTEPTSYAENSVIGAYAKTKALASQYVLAACSTGLKACLVVPSGIIGPYDLGRNHLVQLVKDYLTGKLKYCVKGGYNLVDVRDVATGCLKASLKGEIGHSYLLTNKYISIKDLLDRVSYFAKIKPIKVLPMFLAYLGLPFITLYSTLTKKRALYTKYSLKVLLSNSNFSNTLAKNKLGYTTRSLDESIKDMVTYLTTNN